MKPPPFRYRAVASVAEATELLAELGTHAAVLAGGQSLLIDLHFRRARPEMVVDINQLSELAQLQVADGWVQIGALVRHRELEQGRLSQIVRSPIHPYARGLLASTVHGAKRGQRLETIPGTPPSLDRAPANCSFASRCTFVQARCLEGLPPNVQAGPGRTVRCILAEHADVATAT